MRLSWFPAAAVYLELGNVTPVHAQGLQGGLAFGTRSVRPLTQTADRNCSSDCLQRYPRAVSRTAGRSCFRTAKLFTPRMGRGQRNCALIVHKDESRPARLRALTARGKRHNKVQAPWACWPSLAVWPGFPNYSQLVRLNSQLVPISRGHVAPLLSDTGRSAPCTYLAQCDKTFLQFIISVA